MTSTYEVKVVPNAEGFMDALREQVGDLPPVGVTTTEVVEYEYDEATGQVTKETRTTTVTAVA